MWLESGLKIICKLLLSTFKPSLSFNPYLSSTYILRWVKIVFNLHLSILKLSEEGELKNCHLSCDVDDLKDC